MRSHLWAGQWVAAQYTLSKEYSQTSAPQRSAPQRSIRPIAALLVRAAASTASAVLRLSSDGGGVHSTHRADLEARGQALPRVVRTRPKLAILAERIRRNAAHLRNTTSRNSVR